MWRESGPLNRSLRSLRRGVRKVAPRCAHASPPFGTSLFGLDCGRLVNPTPRTSRLSATLAGGDARAMLAQLIHLMACGGSLSILYGSSGLAGGTVGGARRTVASPHSILAQPAENAAMIMQLLAACVAVCSSPSHWPCWVRARFRPYAVEKTSGCTAVLLSTPPRRRQATTQDDAHIVALSALTFVTRWLSSAAAPLDDATAAVVLRELRFVALLCAICIAPSFDAATQLAVHAARTSDEAAGVALATYVRTFLTTTHTDQSTADEAEEKQACTVSDVEARWLSSWDRIHEATSTGNMTRQGCRDSVRGLTVIDWCTLRQEHMHWWLHCLLTHKRYDEVQARVQTPRGTDDATGRHGTLALLRSDTRAMLLTRLPIHLLRAAPVVHDSLVSALVSDISTTSLGDGSETRTARRGRCVALVTTDARLFARLLERLVARCQDAQDERLFCCELSRVHALLSTARADPLVASLVPPLDTLAAVMMARPNAHRRSRLRELVAALQQCLSALCCESGSGELCGGDDGATVTSRYSSDPLRLANLARWRRREANVADAIITLATRLLCTILFLSAAREGSLPRRTAEPLWRRRLRERSAVRAHKYHLLLCELPHDLLSSIAHTLITYGYLREAYDLGRCLLQHERIDLKAYPLSLLGALYQTMLWVGKSRRLDNDDPIHIQAAGLAHYVHDDTAAIIHPAMHAPADEGDLGAHCALPALLQQLHALYTRRQEVFGETTATTPRLPSLAQVDYALNVVQQDRTVPATTTVVTTTSVASLHAFLLRSLHQQLCRACTAPGGVPILDCRQPMIFAHWRVEGHAVASVWD